MLTPIMFIAIIMIKVSLMDIQYTVTILLLIRLASHPAHRFGRPEEFGRTCAYLCSVHAGYINGQNILMDGGSFPGVF